MNISRRERYPSTGHSVAKTNKRVDIVFDIMSLNILCSYVLSDNKNIRRGHLVNLRNLLAILNMEPYANDNEKKSRIEFINKGLDARLNYSLSKPEMIIKHINGGIIDTSIIDINTYSDISNQELKWVSDMVTESLDYAFAYNGVKELKDACLEFEASTPGNKGDAIQRLKTVIAQFNTQFRRNKVETLTDARFSLSEGEYQDSIRDIHQQLVSPVSKLVCGMQGINEMIGGGFQSGRVYMLFGLPGEGKSSTLLNLAYQIKKYNKHFRAKDPTKIPTVLLLTMENTVKETIERLFNIAGCRNRMTDYTADQVIDLLKTEGELNITDDNPINLVIKYVPDKSVDTSYLYTICEDLEDEGYEVICLIQDYVKRLRSIDYCSDLRLELGNITNEMKTFAEIRDIPVISASQLNRDAASSIDDSKKHNKADVIKTIGRSNIGESMLMLENIDCGIFIVPELKEISGVTVKYMGFQRIKIRYYTSGRESLFHPFEENQIKLVEDEGLAIPAFKETLMDAYSNSSGVNMITGFNDIKKTSGGLNTRTAGTEDNSFFNDRIVSSNQINTVLGAKRKLQPAFIFIDD